jgi:hypothetical protein
VIIRNRASKRKMIEKEKREETIQNELGDKWMNDRHIHDE